MTAGCPVCPATFTCPACGRDPQAGPPEPVDRGEYGSAVVLGDGLAGGAR